MVENLNNTCRVCLRSNVRKCMSLFENLETSTIASHISSLVHFEISENDQLPNKICFLCFKQLQAAVAFKLKCESSQATLLATLTTKKEQEQLKEEECLKVEQLKQEFLEEIPDTSKDFLEETAVYFSEDEKKITVSEIDTYSVENDAKNNVKFDLDCKDSSLDTAVLKDNKSHFKSYNKQNEKNDNANLIHKQPNHVEQGLRPSKAIDLKLECDDCKEVFKSKCKLRVHWKTIHLPQALTCPLCRARFSNFKLLRMHRTDYRMKIKCEVISKANITSFGKTRTFHCKQCSYKTDKSFYWRNHYICHNGERPHTCEICSSTFTQISSLQSHKESIHNIILKEIACHYCGILLKGRNKIYKHLKRHTCKMVSCDICGKMVKEYCLKQHKLIHKRDKKEYKCDICDLSYSSMVNLISHKRRHPEYREELKCDICQFKTINNKSFKRHQHLHKSSVSFTCKICYQLCSTELCLKNHMKIHVKDSDKKFKCSSCDKRYMRNSACKNHMNKVHYIDTLNSQPTNKVKKDATAEEEIEVNKLKTKISVK